MKELQNRLKELQKNGSTAQQQEELLIDLETLKMDALTPINALIDEVRELATEDKPPEEPVEEEPVKENPGQGKGLAADVKRG